MKRLIFTFLFFTFALVSCVFAQSPDVAMSDSQTVITTVVDNATITPQENIENTIFEKMGSGFMEFIDYVNWLFVVVFMILTWLVGDYSIAENKATWLNWLSKIPRLLLAFGVGLLLIGVFYWGFDYHGKTDVMQMLFSILTSLVIYKIGVDKVFKWLSTYVLKLQLPENKPTNTTPQP